MKWLSPLLLAALLLPWQAAAGGPEPTLLAWEEAAESAPEADQAGPAGQAEPAETPDEGTGWEDDYYAPPSEPEAVAPVELPATPAGPEEPGDIHEDEITPAPEGATPAPEEHSPPQGPSPAQGL